MTDKASKSTPSDLAARCQEIQTGLRTTEVPEFDHLVLIGMAVRLALHIRGLPAVAYEILRLVAYHYLGISSVALRSVLEVLAEIDFIKIGSEGRTIHTIVPNVPYYEDLYDALGEYANDVGFNESEQLSLEIIQRLSRSPEKVDSLRNSLGADNSLFTRSLDVGQRGAYIKLLRARGRDIILTPTYFSQNPNVFADIVAGGGAKQIQKLMAALTKAQGYPLALIEKSGTLGDIEVTNTEKQLLIRLAQDGAVKPPSITTEHAGENYFLFTPTPGDGALAPTKKDIYEKAMAIVAAIRQGQFLPKRYAIREPGAVAYTLRRDLKLARATTEAAAQYKNLVHLRIAQLVDAGHGYKQLHIIDTEENREALDIAYALIDAGTAKGIEVDEEARRALQQDQTYVESLIASATLGKTKKVEITPEQQEQLELLLLK